MHDNTVKIAILEDGRIVNFEKIFLKDLNPQHSWVSGSSPLNIGDPWNEVAATSGESRPWPQDKKDLMISKSVFRLRTLPFAADIKAAKQHDPVLEEYFAILSEEPLVNLTRLKTVNLIKDAIKRVLLVVPESKISEEVLLKPIQLGEAFD